MLAPNQPTRLIEHGISSASAKFHEMRKILTNKRLSRKVRGRYFNAFVRSRLCYNIATWNNPDSYVKKLDVVWLGMLRKAVKGGFRRKPNSMAFVYSNADLLKMMGCMSIDRFAERQQLKWLAHCVRMENDALQKISLFMIPSRKYHKSVWTRIESKTGMDKEQFWRMAKDRARFNSYIETRYGSLND